MCKTGLSAPGRGVFPPLVCETARSAPGRCFSPRSGCETGLSAPGLCVSLRSWCETALSAPGRGASPPPVCETGRSAPGRCFSPPHLLPPRHPDRPCAAAPPRLSLLSSLALAKRSSYPIPPSLPTFRSVWSRCLRWDETADFHGFCAVSVPEMGRDCRFSGILSGVGA